MDIKIDFYLLVRSKKNIFRNLSPGKKMFHPCEITHFKTSAARKPSSKIAYEAEVCRPASRKYHQLGYQESSRNRQKFL